MEIEWLNKDRLVETLFVRPNKLDLDCMPREQVYQLIVHVKGEKDGKVPLAQIRYGNGGSRADALHKMLLWLNYLRREGNNGPYQRERAIHAVEEERLPDSER